MGGDGLPDMDLFWNGWDARAEAEYLKACINGYFGPAKDAKAVIAISGGLDSIVTAYLTTEALGGDRVLGVYLPENDCPNPVDERHARSAAYDLGIELLTYDMTPILSEITKQMPKLIERDGSGNYKHPNAYGNVKARLRTPIMARAVAQTQDVDARFIGTSDRSELLLGYYTKDGDNTGDVKPIQGLYKTQVRKLGRELGVDEEIIKKPSSANLVKGVTAEGEMGLRFEWADPALYHLFDCGFIELPESDMARRMERDAGIDDRIAKSVLKRYLSSQHKRDQPVSFPPFWAI